MIAHATSGSGPARGGAGGAPPSLGSVVHGSTSSISCASYPARKLGLHAEMRVGRALELVPELVVLPYNFEDYTLVSDKLYKVFFKYTKKVEAVSCDEAYLEFPQNTEAFAIAERIRADIYKATRCKASAGISNSKMLARIATKRHALPFLFPVIESVNYFLFLSQ